MRCVRLLRLDSTDCADRLPSMARLSKDSSTGSRDCASSRVKVFIARSRFDTEYDENTKMHVAAEGSRVVTWIRESVRLHPLRETSADGRACGSSSGGCPSLPPQTRQPPSLPRRRLWIKRI